MNYSTVSIMQPFKLWNRTANDIQNGLILKWELNVTLQYVVASQWCLPYTTSENFTNPYLVIDRTKLNLILQA
jgi:hypothetical protein